MSESIKFSISLTPETYEKLMKKCDGMIPRSRLIESILEKSLSKICEDKN